MKMKMLPLPLTMPQSLAAEDVGSILRLIVEVTNPANPKSFSERRYAFAQGLVKLVEADAWVWSCTTTAGELSDSMSTCVIDGGWESPAEQGRFYEFLTSPESTTLVNPVPYRIMAEGSHQTLDIVEAFLPENFELGLETWKRTGFEHLLLSLFPLDKGLSSNFGMYRRIGKPAFTPRDKLIVHTVLGQVGWFNHYSGDKASGIAALDLTPREKQTLVFLLGGFSHKEIAQRLGVSPHTITDYVKSLHQKYDVTSRAELQAKVFLGRKPE